MLLSTQDKLANVAGSPYLSEEFTPGDIYYNLGKNKIEELPVRYNIYNDQFEYKGQRGIMAIGSPQNIDSIVVDDEVFILIPKRPGHNLSGFVRKLNHESPLLLTKMNVEFFKREEKKPFDLDDPKPDRLERMEDRYYLMKDESDIQKISTVKKMIKYLGKHNAELTKYAKKEKVNVTDPESLLKLLQYSHTLN